MSIYTEQPPKDWRILIVGRNGEYTYEIQTMVPVGSSEEWKTVLDGSAWTQRRVLKKARKAFPITTIIYTH